MVPSLCDLGYVMKPVLAIDAKASDHILHRQGIGRLKHIDVTYFWIHDEVRSKRLRVRRVRSEGNVADLSTKALSKAVISKHSMTLVCVNMTEEKADDVQQDVAMFGTSDQVQVFETGGRAVILQNSVGDHAKHQHQQQWQRQRKKGLQVLYIFDTVDAYAGQEPKKFDGKAGIDDQGGVGH